MSIVSGVFSEVGTSQTWTGSPRSVVMVKFGTGTVKLEAHDPENNNWVPVSSHASDYAAVVDGFSGIDMRLNCTALVSDIDYYVKP